MTMGVKTARAASTGPAGSWEIVSPVLLSLCRLQRGAGGSGLCSRLRLQGLLRQ